jgi:transcriptional regulator with XRE-family HTH domain
MLRRVAPMHRPMTTTSAGPEQDSPIAQRLRDSRERAGLGLDQAAAATGLLRSYLSSLEDGRRRPLPREVDRLAAAYAADLSDLLPARRPVEVDAAAGRISVDGRTYRVREGADEREVYAAYLFLLYALRGATPGERIALRASDVDLLMEAMGEDAETIETRLVQLMGCTPDEATMLGGELLRHRASSAVDEVHDDGSRPVL